jgi:hypothetical protein
MSYQVICGLLLPFVGTSACGSCGYDRGIEPGNVALTLHVCPCRWRHVLCGGRGAHSQDERGEHSNWGTVAFSVGFVLMMVLDVALG